MRIVRESYKGWKIEFVYSPYFEMISSLHVLFNPEHHKMRLDWAKALKTEMSKKLFDKLKFFDDVSENWMGAIELRCFDDKYDDFNIVRAVDLLEGVKLEDFVFYLLNKELGKFDIKKILTLKKVHIEGLRQTQIDFLLNAEEYKNEFISLLKEYYYLHFQNIQMEIEPYIIRTLNAHKSLSENMDFLDYINLLHPRIEIREDKLCFHKYKRFDLHYNKLQEILIGISTFIDPHLLLEMDESFLSLTIRAKIEKVENDVHEDLVMTLKALGDKTRMRIVKCLYDKPTSTQELAAKLEISEAGISKHLKLLYQSKVIDKARQGNYIIYFLDQLMIDRIPMNMYQYLDE